MSFQKRISVTTTFIPIILPSNHRKSWLIQNSDNTNSARISTDTLGTTYVELKPWAIMTSEIPQGNPNKEVFARSASGTITLETWEDYSKKGA